MLQVNVISLKSSELQEIIEQMHPTLRTISDRLVNVFSLFSTLTETDIPQSERLISTRDLFKWCSRVAVDFDVSNKDSKLRVLQDAIDVFCCSYPKIEDRLVLAIKISSYFNIIPEQANYFCNQYKPNVVVTSEKITIGRCTLQRINCCDSVPLKYCFTRPAACLLEKVAICVSRNEPLLLVGETGTGKTSTVQYLANLMGQKLTVINMNQQSDSADLLGGFKPVDMKFIMGPVKMEFEDVFCSYFNSEHNKKFLSNINYCYNTQRYYDLVKLMKKSYEAAMERLKNISYKSLDTNEEIKYKNSKKRNVLKDELHKRLWTNFGKKLLKLEQQIKQKNELAFAFIKGSLVKAIENGYFVLLDEINLTSPETLDALLGLLENSGGSISLIEKGDKTPISRHPNFRLFACMNPSTDVGKHNLPTGLRNRFTEFFVDELTEKNDLLHLVSSYLEAMSLKTEKLERIVKFYLNIRKEAVSSLCDGLGHKPHFSLRTLCRSLMIASKSTFGSTRSLYEAFCLSFLTQLDRKSYCLVEEMIVK